MSSHKMTGNPSSAVGAAAAPSGTHGAVEFLPSLDRTKLRQTLEARTTQQQHQRTRKEERRTSIFKSLDVLDVDANDVDYSAAHNYQSVPPAAAATRPTRGGRYLRRGSVVRTKIEADSGGMQPTEVSGGNESDYGSDYDSNYGSDYDSGVDSDADTASLCSQGGSENTMQRRQRHHRRYLRRGSVTKYSLDASVGDKVVGMQPASAAEEAVRSVRDGRTSRLPPPPTNSFRKEQNDETEYGYEQDDRGVAEEASDKDGMKKSAGSAKKPPLDTKRRPRRSRRGSMRMPGDDGTVKDPLPGHELYSGNLDDSGHHRRNLYFDSTEAFQAHPPRDMASVLTSTIGASSTNRHSARPHPLERKSGHGPPRSFIDPQKTPSGRNLMVDETEMFRNDVDDDDDDNDNVGNNKDYYGQLETIGSVPTPSSRNGTYMGIMRRESSSSAGSDSSSEFASDDFAGDSDLKIPAVKQTPKKAAPVKLPPKLPPSYSSKPTKSVKRVPPPPPRRKHKKTHEDDSTSSSTRSEEEDGSANPAAAASTFAGIKAVPRQVKGTKSKKPGRRVSSASSSSSSSSPTKKTKQRRSSTSATSAHSQTVRIKGCLRRREGQRSSSSSTWTGVRFGNIVITEFPIILGDNPAVTSGAPVTIDWTPQAENSFSVNAYEQFKPARRRRRKLLISVSSRAILLLAAGYSVDEIADASINAQQIKHGRQATLQANQNWDRVSLLMENTNDAVAGMVVQPLSGLMHGTNGALTGMMQNTGKKLKALIPKPVKHSETARTA